MRPLTAWAVLPLAVASADVPDILALNRSIGGRVHVNEPFALPCFSQYEGQPVERDEALCADRQQHYADPEYRRQFAGAYMYDQSSMCASDAASTDKCLLNSDDPSDPSAWADGVDCRQGNVPPYYVDVRGPDDVVQSLRYARAAGVTVAVKNSGHTYVEDSSFKGGLALWMRNLRNLTHDSSFVPQGCDAADGSSDAVTVGAGVSCGEAYEYADAEGITILCGYSPTVGLSGGWVQGGGHSVLSNVYGLGADRVLQFTVVTPDGQVRVANRCQHPDLFWALRGGGGGTYGVVLDSTHRVEPVVPLAVASVAVPATNQSAYIDWMALLVDTALDLAADGWGGHIYGNSLVYVSPRLANDTDAAHKSLARLVDFATAHGGSANITAAPTWYDFFREFVIGSTVVVGNLNIINTRLVPTAKFADAQGAADLKAFFAGLVRAGQDPYIPVDSPHLFRPAEATAANPAWYASLWELGQPAYWAWNGTLEERKEAARMLQRQTAQMEALTPGSGAYKNEANPFTLDWRDAWYGEHYDRLLAIKQRYDPDRLLRCWGCIGWTDEDAKKSCYAAFWDIQP